MVTTQFGAVFIAVLVLPVVLLSRDPVAPELAAVVAALAAAARVHVRYQRVRLA
ncbi:hypothetical protein ACFVUW_11000 [Streptomyces xiamenensis]|uniref:hypothetical protein n=1 Tax=Streptomyces xiamenensis TaxID=408015 RepID=UPI0036F07D1E